MGLFQFGAEAEQVKSFQSLESSLGAQGAAVSGATPADLMCGLCGLGLLQVSPKEAQEDHALPRCICSVPALPAVLSMHSWVCEF